MKYAYVSAVLAGLVSTTFAQSPCLDACQTTENACRVAPNANQSTCSANAAACRAQCTTSSTPVVSMTSAAATHTPGPIVEEKVVVVCHVCEEQAHEECKTECFQKNEQCCSLPGADLSSCASEHEYCVTTCPPKPQPMGPECEVKCQDADNKCRTTPGANLSTCASTFEQCKASCPKQRYPVNPGPVRPEVCKTECQTKDNECRGRPGANLSTCASEYAACESKCPTMPPTPPPAGPECEKKCQDTDNKCRTTPGANLSTCASDFASCQSKCPVRTLVPVPQPAPTNSKVVVNNNNGNKPAAQVCTIKCDTVYTECCAAPGAVIETCGHAKQVCYERCPPAGHNNGTILTAGSERMQPAFMAVAALGFAALF